MEPNHLEKLMAECLQCKQCSNCCSLLAKSGQSPLDMTKRGITLYEALSCSLCGACETVCPKRLSPKQLFLARRREAVKSGEIDSAAYRYLLPDRKNNIMNAYRSYYGIDYSDVNSFSHAETCFFPGCTLMTYSPNLTRAIYERLKDSCGCKGVWTECCGKLLDQIGLQERVKDFRSCLQGFVQEHNIKRIIVACPGCYYELQDVFQACDVIVQTVYEVIDFAKQEQSDNRQYTVHDSCPDRFAGIFGSQVRQALKQCGFSTREMAHTQMNTICCGSGGQLSHFRPELVEELVKLRQQEVRETNADVLVGYCLNCVLKYDNYSSEIPVTHALNLLLGLQDDYKGGKARLEKMFSGSDGEKRWEEIIAD
ncbi:Fe-S oxidoreductase [Sporomusaceae bacterium BoRhaA]|uniref:(Fe-S)-binding protein n=1 Tax=Pelorhabdus rhamnosifermentans TaxID=2772457 RepID=UPI001C05F17C|nr:(Fe-S)-binding protein [Pelorhabdus rhamnosifermentans]MBU2702343.1 Fe-S oxidoreductase [Pelorhabdus rhamnosifermentans]